MRTWKSVLLVACKNSILKRKDDPILNAQWPIKSVSPDYDEEKKKPIMRSIEPSLKRA